MSKDKHLQVQYIREGGLFPLLKQTFSSLKTNLSPASLQMLERLEGILDQGEGLETLTLPPPIDPKIPIPPGFSICDGMRYQVVWRDAVGQERRIEFYEGKVPLELDALIDELCDGEMTLG